MSPTKRLILCCGSRAGSLSGLPATRYHKCDASHHNQEQAAWLGYGTSPTGSSCSEVIFPLAVVADVNGTRDIIVLQHTAVGSEIVSVHGIVGRVDHAVAVVIARRTISGQAEQQAGSRRLERIEA